jgi:hypothetical protein
VTGQGYPLTTYETDYETDRTSPSLADLLLDVGPSAPALLAPQMFYSLRLLPLQVLPVRLRLLPVQPLPLRLFSLFSLELSSFQLFFHPLAVFSPGPFSPPQLEIAPRPAGLPHVPTMGSVTTAFHRVLPNTRESHWIHWNFQTAHLQRLAGWDCPSGILCPLLCVFSVGCVSVMHGKKTGSPYRLGGVRLVTETIAATPLRFLSPWCRRYRFVLGFLCFAHLG